MSTQKTFGILLGCLLMACTSLAFADNGQPPGGQPGRNRGGNTNSMSREAPPALPDSSQIVNIVAQMAKSLDLTDQQQSQISDLHFAHFAAAEALLSNTSGDRESQRREMDALRQDFEKQVKALLTDEQKSKFEKMAQSRQDRSRQPRQRRN